MTDPTPDVRAEWRRAAELSSTVVSINSRILLDLLDAADERDRLQGLIDEVGAHVQWSAESGVTLLEYLDQLCEDAGETVVAVERVRAMHVPDDEGFCRVCDYGTVHPCPTIRTLGEAEERDRLADVEERLSVLLWRLTNGRLSKTDYPVEFMEQAIEENLAAHHESDLRDERDRLAAVVERVEALAPVDVSDWDEDDPLMVSVADLHRALDGTDEKGSNRD